MVKKRRVLIRRRDGHRQGYWVGRKLKKRKRTSKLFRTQLEDKGIEIYGPLRKKKVLQKFFRKYPEEMDVLKLRGDVISSRIFLDHPTKSIGKFHISRPSVGSDKLRTSITLSPSLFSQKKVEKINLPRVLKHEIGHLQDFKQDPFEFRKQYRIEQEKRKGLKVYNLLPSEVSADKYAAKVSQRKLAQLPEFKLKGEKSFKKIFE